MSAETVGVFQCEKAVLTVEVFQCEKVVLTVGVFQCDKVVLTVRMFQCEKIALTNYQCIIRIFKCNVVSSEKEYGQDIG